MKSTSLFLLASVGAIAAGCSMHWSPATQLGLSTTVKASGTPGGVLIGHYICNAERFPFTNSLPFSITRTGLTVFEVRKVRASDDFTLTARQGGAEVTSTAPQGIPGLRVVLDNGVEIQTLTERH